MTERDADPSTGPDDQVIPAAASDSWRAWLMTGVRRGPVARRRVRGAHKGIKKILVEGTSNGGDVHPWKDFSGVMIRQAVDEAVNTLPVQQKQVVKLAYFAGLSNREIGEKLGLSVAGVEKRLRQALSTVSEYVERGRSSGQRAVFGLIMFLPNRLFASQLRRNSGVAIDHLMQAGAVAGAGAVAVAVLAMTPASPSHVTQVDRGSAPVVTATQANAIVQPVTGIPQQSGITSIAGSLHVGAAAVKAPTLPSLPIKVPPHPITLPPLPSPPQLP
jgi:sigma-70-like protein